MPSHTETWQLLFRGLESSVRRSSSTMTSVSVDPQSYYPISISIVESSSSRPRALFELRSPGRALTHSVLPCQSSEIVPSYEHPTLVSRTNRPQSTTIIHVSLPVLGTEARILNSATSDLRRALSSQSLCFILCSHLSREPTVLPTPSLCHCQFSRTPPGPNAYIEPKLPIANPTKVAGHAQSYPFSDGRGVFCAIALHCLWRKHCRHGEINRACGAAFIAACRIREGVERAAGARNLIPICMIPQYV